MSLDNALIDIGSSTFTCGQAYVALSRLKTLSGVHLINFDPSKIKALHPAIVEYNRLLSLYCPHLMALKYTSSRRKKIKDREWTIHPTIIEAQNDPEEPKPKRKKTSRPKYPTKRRGKK